MDNKEYNFRVGTIMVIASFIFFLLPAFFELDAFIPVMLSMFSLLVGIAFFFMGHGKEPK